jgi:MEMO1 family protein
VIFPMGENMPRVNRVMVGASVIALLLVSAGIGCARQADQKAAAEGKKTTLANLKNPLTAPKALVSHSSSAAKVRAPVLAGGAGDPGWYPGSAAELRQSVQGYLNAAALPPGSKAHAALPAALIVPHAGHRWSGPTAAYAYKTIEGKSFRRVFILAPNHRAPLSGAAVPSYTAFATPLGEVPVDTEVTEALAKQPGFVMDDQPHVHEHAIEIQLPFLQVALKPGFRIVPIIVGEISTDKAAQLAAVLRSSISQGDLVLISSDFTHYGPNFDYTPFTTDIPNQLKKLDLGAFEQIQKFSAEGLARYKNATGITACGYHPLLVLLSLISKSAPAAAAHPPASPAPEAVLLRYDRSADASGDYSTSVSYLAIAVYGADFGAPPSSAAAPGSPIKGVKSVGGPQVLSADEQLKSLKLARAAIETHLHSGRKLNPADIGISPSGKLLERYGVFVTLEKGGELRGCIGNIIPVARLFEGIIGRAIDAAVDDYRFPPVKSSELSEIEIEISVLTKPYPVPDTSKIVLGKHGIVLSKTGRGAVFLPQVAPEQGWNLEQTLSHLAQKAGLDRDAWRQGAQFELFEAQVFREDKPK